MTPGPGLATPSNSVSTPAMMRSDDLPAPFSPTMPILAPSKNARSMPLRIAHPSGSTFLSPAMVYAYSRVAAAKRLAHRLLLLLARHALALALAAAAALLAALLRQERHRHRPRSADQRRRRAARPAARREAERRRRAAHVNNQRGACHLLGVAFCLEPAHPVVPRSGEEACNGTARPRWSGARSAASSSRTSCRACGGSSDRSSSARARRPT